jgi:hypothetical protein
MNKKLLAMVFATFLPFASMAEEAKSSINYDYVGVGFGSIELDDLAYDADATSFEGSLSIGENFNLLGNTASASGTGCIDDVCDTIKIDMTKIGVGYHITIQKNTDLQISVLNVDFKVKASGPLSAEFRSEGIDGHQLSVGFATMLSDSTEASLTFNRYSMGEFDDSGTSIKIVHSITNSIALQAHIENIDGDGIDTVVSTFGVRYKL